MKHVKKLLFGTILLLAFMLPTVSFAAENTEEKIDIQKYAEAMQPGWNLGNTFDSVGKDETAWGNPTVTKEFIEQLAEQGYKSIRIPVTFDQRMAEGPSYTIDADFLSRLDQVIKWSLDQNLYVMINIHHDSWIWLESGMQENHDASLARYSAIWTQLATHYKDQSTKLMFESINEPRFWGTDEEKQGYLDELNSSFYDIVRKSGGKNDIRPIVLPTLDTGSEQHKLDALYNFIDKLDDPNIISTVHYYGFWPFSVNIAGFTTFNEETQKDIITTFDRVHDKFTKNGIPVVIGEFGLLGFDTDLNTIQQGEKLKFFEFMIHYANEKDLTHMLWDNGQHFSRTTFKWSNPELYEMMKTSWTTRSATADSNFIYVEQGEAIKDVNKTINANGNKLVSLELAGAKLVSGQDYDLVGDVLTVKASLLENVISSEKLGINATLVATFDKGKSWNFDVITYNTPVLQSTVGTAANFAIPTTFNGDNLATMEAVYADGSFAGPQNWTSFKEFAYTFAPNYDTNKIVLKENFFKEVNDGTVKLTLHFWSGEVLTYMVTKSGDKIVGYAEETAAAGSDITRAEFIQMLMNTFDLLDEEAVSSFTDVEKDASYANAVASAEKLQIINGNGNNEFGVNDHITREDTAVILHRVMTLLEIKDGKATAVTFKDQDSISKYAVTAVSKLQQSGIILGKANGNYDPSSFATRAEATTMMYRLLIQHSAEN